MGTEQMRIEDVLSDVRAVVGECRHTAGMTAARLLGEKDCMDCSPEAPRVSLVDQVVGLQRIVRELHDTLRRIDQAI